MLIPNTDIREKGDGCFAYNYIIVFMCESLIMWIEKSCQRAKQNAIEMAFC